MEMPTMNRDELLIKLNEIHMQSYSIPFDESLQLDKSVDVRHSIVKTNMDAILAEYDVMSDTIIELSADRDSEKRWADEYHQHAEEMTKECKRLEEENTRLREALGKYADRDNWRISDTQCRDCFLQTEDGWEIAEAAMKGIAK
jgi:uncharacterized coiled-coil DUF342 family protein